MNKTKVDGRGSDRLGQRSIFFSNILLLGFEPGAMEAKYSIPFTKDMFAMPNKKAFEVVMYFLLTRLNPALAKERFRVCYPVCDKKQEQLFRRAVTNWLTEITKDSGEAYLPRIAPSLLMSPSGDKFYNLLLHLSAHVLTVVAKSSHGLKSRDLLQRPRLVPSSIHLGSVMAKTVGASAIRHRKRFLQQLQETTAMQDQWTQYAAELTKEHRTLSKSIRGLEQKLQDQYDKANHLAKARGSPPPVRRHQSGECFEGEPEIQAIRRTKKVHKIRELWKAVDNLHTTQKPERDVLQSVVEGAANRFKLDANDINVHIPELLLRDCEKELQRRNLANTYEGGKLNLLTLIHLWNLSLHLYLEQLNQVSLPDFGELAPAVVTQVHNQHTHLANTQTLRSTLSNELLPQLKESIAMLKEELELQGDSTLRQTDSLSSSRNKSHDLTLLPSTPPVSFQPDTNMRGGTPQEITGKPLQKSPDIMDTPEAASLLRSVIDKAALRRTAIAQGTPVSTNRNLKDMGSKLPRPTTTVGSDVVEDRKRIKSAPSRSQYTSTPSCEPLRHPKTTKKASNGSYIHHQIGNQTVEDKANKDHVKDHVKVHVKERRDVKKTDTKKKFKPKRNHHHKPSSAVKATTTANGSDTSALRDINTLTVSDIGTPAVKDLGTPAVSDTRTPAVSSINKPKSTAKVTTAAHTLLADQIADAVAGSFVDGNTPSPNSQPLALDDPLAALHQTAFTTRDKLNRTPERKTAKENGEERVSTSKSSQMPTKKLFDGKLLSLSLIEAASLLRSVIDKAALRRTAIAQGTPVSTNRNLKDMGSKLPRPTTTVGSDVVEDRKRIKSAPSRSQYTSTPSCAPLRHPKTTKKASNGSYIHHQIGNQTVEDKANKDHVKDHVKERRDVKKTDTKKKFKPKRNHHHKPSSAVKATTTANGSDTSALRDINTLAVSDIGTPAVKDLGTPAVSDTRTPAVSSINKPKSTAKVTTAAHTLLADQIADAVAGSFVDGNTPSPNSQPLALDDPLAALHQTAFTTRDKLNRTPERKTAKENGEERVSTSKSSQMPTKKLFDEDWLASPPGYQDIVVSEFKEEQSVIKETYEKNSNAGLSAKSHQKTDIKPEDNSEPKVMREDYSNSDYSTQHAYHTKLDLELQASDSPVIGTPEGLYKDFQSDLSEIFASKTPSLPLRSRQRLKARKDNFVDSPIVESMRTSVAMKTSLSTGIEMPMDGLGSPNGDISAGFTLDDLLKETRLSVESGSSEISGESMPKSALKARNGSDDSQKSVHFSSGYQENIFEEEANSSSDRSLAENAKTKHENLDEDLDQFSGSVHSHRNRLSGMFSEDESFDLDISRPVEELLHYISPATTPTHLESHGGVRLSSHPTDSPFDISKHDATVSLLERLKLTSVSSDNASPRDTQMRKEMSDRNQQELVNTMDFHDDFCAVKISNLQREDDCELSKSTVTRSTSNFDLLDESDDSILMPSSPMLGNDYSPIDQMVSPLAGNVHPSIIPPSPAVGQLIDI
ncbi:mucin-17-like [Anneissia japonica]|uniref:mucin-17-like n=1 Tax=Anneissia japonica TaxID=1529436 RepID=UPI0014257EDD|nr:mucin-17-like [Anneissia japonica]